MTIWGRFCRALGTFWGERSGNFAILAALAAIPMVGAAGLAVDYATMSRMRLELQQALDAAVLAVAQRGDRISDAEAYRIAGSFMTGNLTPAYRDLVITRRGTSVRLTAATPAHLAFAGLFGFRQVVINAASTADIAAATYEVALVLDTTGSMREGSKLQDMKDAVGDLIDDLSGRVSDPERLKFALVPFASFVNVGPQFGPQYDRQGRRVPGTGARWLDIEGRSPIPQLDLVAGVSRFDLYRHLDKTWTGCVETRAPDGGKAHDEDDTPASTSDPASLFVPAFAIDEPDDTRRAWGRTRYVYDNNYLPFPDSKYTDPLDSSSEARARRLLKYGLIEEALSLDSSVKKLKAAKAPTDVFGWGIVDLGYNEDAEGPTSLCVTEPIVPLSNDYAELKRKVRRLKAEGNTNIMEGVAWGMRVLSPEEPFSEGKQDAADVKKIMIVLTDGANTFGVDGSKDLGSPYTSFGYLADGRLSDRVRSEAQAKQAMNEKTLAACRNAKEKGYTIYTIRLEEPDVATGTLLKDCASSPGNYYDTPSSSELDRVFDSIRDGITELRIAA